MPLRSRAFCLSLRSRRLDFIPGGIYQGALNSFIHSLPYSSPPHAHTHMQLHVSHANVVCCIFGKLFFTSSRSGIVRSSAFFPLANSCVRVLLHISGSLSWPNLCSHIYPMCVQIYSPPSLSLTWSGISPEQHQWFLFLSHRCSC